MALALRSTYLRPIARVSQGSTRPAGSVVLEHPVIVVRDEGAVDLIGPPDAHSHLRPIVRGVPTNESPAQRRFRQAADATQQWNQAFWAAHNGRFLLEKGEFVKAKPQLSADEMSEFYRDFLNANWGTHVRYNFEWYRRNFALLGLALCASLECRFSLKYRQ